MTLLPPIKIPDKDGRQPTAYGPGSYDEDGGWYECKRCGALTGDVLCPDCAKSPKKEPDTPVEAPRDAR